MNKILFFGILLSILFVQSLQQTKITVAPDPFQQFNNALKRNLIEYGEPTSDEIEFNMSDNLRKQIAIWTSIGLSFVLYFSVIAIIDMPNPKSSILYAKYDTTRGGNEY